MKAINMSWLYQHRKKILDFNSAFLFRYLRAIDVVAAFFGIRADMVR